MTTSGEVEHRVGMSLWGDWMDWMDDRMSGFPFFGLPSLWRPLVVAERSIRCEEFVEDDRYVLRAELPGVDPGKEVEVTVANGRLSITARRTRTVKDQRHSEFYYGTMTRTVVLPPGADTDDVTADYTDGVLEVTVPLGTAPARNVTSIPVKHDA
jgi:HSP20 family molecular chaperone IbpA